MFGAGVPITAADLDDDSWAAEDDVVPATGAVEDSTVDSVAQTAAVELPTQLELRARVAAWLTLHTPERLR